jgi:hypothetical protein
MKITRAFAMPSHNTLTIKPIKGWVCQFLKAGKIADPFARNCKIAHLTNDLDPSTQAKYHMKASDFLLLDEVKGSALVIFDPLYTLRQVKECYEGSGYEFLLAYSQNAQRWTIERDIISKWQKSGDIVLSFGYNTVCMGKKRGYKIISILICAHGPAHNDTLCVAEEKI